MKHREKGVNTHAKFNVAVEKLVMKLGGSLAPQPDTYKWQIPTKGGILLVDVHEPQKSALFSVFCRFDDVEKANALNISNNRHSGKYNFHCADAKELLSDMELHIKAIQ
jgi:hypothetical protein